MYFGMDVYSKSMYVWRECGLQDMQDTDNCLISERSCSVYWNASDGWYSFCVVKDFGGQCTA